jgi:hypothetical protein
MTHQLPPNYIDPNHSEEDRILLETFYLACQAEGGTSDEVILRGIKAVLAPAAESEVAELVAWLRETGQLLSRRPDIQCRVELCLFDRAADLLLQQERRIAQAYQDGRRDGQADAQQAAESAEDEPSGEVAA